MQSSISAFQKTVILQMISAKIRQDMDKIHKKSPASRRREQREAGAVRPPSAAGRLSAGGRGNGGRHRRCGLQRRTAVEWCIFVQRTVDCPLLMDRRYAHPAYAALYEGF